MIGIDIHDYIHFDFEKIIWDEFFLKKNRGVSLRYHYPFLYTNSREYYNIIVRHSEKVVGGLILQINSSADGLYGAIGMVCIKEAFRGKGLFNILFESTLNFSKQHSIHKLVLWTSKHDLYKNFDFVKKTQEVLLLPSTGSNCQKLKWTLSDGKEFDLINKPPYATNLSTLLLRNNTIGLFKDKIGTVIFDYQGKPQEINDIIHSFTCKEMIKIIISENDELFKFIIKNTERVEVIKEQTEMWWVDDSQGKLVSKPYISLLDRI